MTSDLLNISKSDYSSTIPQTQVSPMSADSITGIEEYTWQLTKADEYWGIFNQCPDLKAAILDKAKWVVAGYTCSPRVKVILDHISGGWGKDSFLDVLHNQYVTMKIMGDSYAEIVNEKGIKKVFNKLTNKPLLLDLKPLHPKSVKIIFGPTGRIIRYEQTTGKAGEKPIQFKPEEIFHLSNNRLLDTSHGISDIDSLKENITSTYESDRDMRALSRHQAKPIMMWKLKTRDVATRDKVIATITAARQWGDDIFLPDSEDAIALQPVETQMSPGLFQWREDLRRGFYRCAGVPELSITGGDVTESGGKVGYMSFSQKIKVEQKRLEAQIWNQLQLEIHLDPPTDIAPALQQDASKDGPDAQMGFQPSDTNAGAGR